MLRRRTDGWRGAGAGGEFGHRRPASATLSGHTFRGRYANSPDAFDYSPRPLIVTMDGVSDTERWGIPDILSITTGHATDPDVAAATIAMTDTVGVLSAEFGPAPTAPVTPTLMFAREETSASYNLDRGYGQASWDVYSWGTRVWADMAGARRQVLAGLSWATYTYDAAGGEWRALELSEALVEIARRYGTPAAGEDPDVVAGQTLFRPAAVPCPA